MKPDSLPDRVLEFGAGAFARAFAAVEKVKERLDRACRALESAGIPYAIVGGNAVAAWVATVDEGAVRATREVDILLRAEDVDRAAAALKPAGFVRDRVMDVTVFLDGAEGKPSQGIHVLIAGHKVRPEYFSAAPDPSVAVMVDDRRVVPLEELVVMKLNSFRLKDRVHLIDMIQTGLVDQTWPGRFHAELGARLQQLLDNPEG